MGSRFFDYAPCDEAARGFAQDDGFMERAETMVERWRCQNDGNARTMGMPLVKLEAEGLRLIPVRECSGGRLSRFTHAVLRDKHGMNAGQKAVGQQGLEAENHV